MSRRKSLAWLCAAAASSLAPAAFAQTWNGAGADNNWTTNLNWVGSTPPAVSGGTANVVMAGSTRLANIANGAYDINSLTFNAGASSFAISGTSLSLRAGGITQNSANLQALSLPIIPITSQIWNTGAGNLTVSGVISSGNSITKTGASTLTLSGTAANTFSGDLIVNAGTVALSKTAGLNAYAGALTIGDGTGTDTVLLLANNQTPNTLVTINSGGKLDLQNFSTSIGALALAGGSVATTTGALSVAGNITFTGNTGSIIGAGTIDFGAVNRTIDVADGTAANDLTITAAIAGSGGYTKTGAGTLFLNNATNSLQSGTFSINAGTVVLLSVPADGSIAGPLVIGDGVGTDILRYTSLGDNISDSVPITINSSGVFDLATKVEGVGSLTMTGGTVTGTGPATLTIFAGITTNAFSSSATISSRLNVIGSNTLNVALGTSSVDLDISGALQSSGTLTKAGAGSVRFSGSNAGYSGNINLQAGTILVGSTLGTGSLIIDGGTLQADGAARILTNPVALNSSLNIDGTQDLTLAGTISGPGGIFKLGSGKLSLENTSATVASSFGGTLFVGGGTVRLNRTTSAAVPLTAAAPVQVIIGDGLGGPGADILSLGASSQLPNSTPIAISNSGRFDLAGFSQQIGQLTLTGGQVTIGTGGTLQLNADSTSNSDASTATITGGTLDLGAGAPRILFVNNGAPATDLDISATITSGVLNKFGTGTLALTGTTPNTHSDTVITTGTLLLGKTPGVSAVPGNLLVAGSIGVTKTIRLLASDQIAEGPANAPFLTSLSVGGLLDLNGFNETLGTLSMRASSITTGAGTLSIKNDITIEGDGTPSSITGKLDLAGTSHIINTQSGSAFESLQLEADVANGAIVKNGPGVLAIGGTNNYAGGLTVNDGYLSIGSNTAAGTGPLTLGTCTLFTRGAATRTLANSVSLNGAVSIFNSATLIFTGPFSGNGTLIKESTGNLGFGGPTSLGGTVVLANGSIGGALTVEATGSFTQNAGDVSATLTCRGPFTLNAGTFTGKLIAEGPITFNASAFFGAGLQVFSGFDLPLGRSVGASGTGIDNSGLIAMSGGTLQAFAPIVNNAAIVGFGSISGANSFSNLAQVTVSGGNLSIATTGLNTSAGNIDVASGLQLRLTGAALSNSGTISLAGGIVAGSATLTNTAGGTLIGKGTVSVPFSNAGGTVQAQGGTLNITSAYSNSGLIIISPGASLGGGAITSTGAIVGAGTLAGAVNNQGLIEAQGLLFISGALSNNASGQLSAPAGATLRIGAGLATNSGLINLLGGSFDNNGFPLNNAGQITGFGTLRTAGLTNNGSLTLTGGLSTVNGNLTNTSGHKVEVRFDPAIFTGNITNNAGATFKITSTTVTFAGTFTNNGTYITDPADNHFTDLAVGPEGALVGFEGDRIFISGNLVSSAAQPLAWDTAAVQLSFTGGLAHQMSLNGSDLGQSWDGYWANFAWAKLSLGSADTLSLLDASGQGPAALYVRTLDLPGGLKQLSSITGNGNTLYYDIHNPANAYLNGATYPLAGGGSVAPVPEPALLGLLAATAPLATRRRRRQLSIHSAIRRS